MKIRRYSNNTTRPTLVMVEKYPEFRVTVIRGNAADLPRERVLRRSVAYLRRDEPPVLAQAVEGRLEMHTADDERFAINSLRAFGVKPV